MMAMILVVVVIVLVIMAVFCSQVVKERRELKQYYKGQGLGGYGDQ